MQHDAELCKLQPETNGARASNQQSPGMLGGGDCARPGAGAGVLAFCGPEAGAGTVGAGAGAVGAGAGAGMLRQCCGFQRPAVDFYKRQGAGVSLE